MGYETLNMGKEDTFDLIYNLYEKIINSIESVSVRCLAGDTMTANVKSNMSSQQMNIINSDRFFIQRRILEIVRTNLQDNLNVIYLQLYPEINHIAIEIVISKNQDVGSIRKKSFLKKLLCF